MALHGDNPSSEGSDGSQDLIAQLQAAYVQAGEEMGKQMAAAIVAILGQMTAGQGAPSCFGWPIGKIPGELVAIIPEEILADASWVYLVSPEIESLPIFQADPTHRATLSSGHVMLVLA